MAQSRERTASLNEELAELKFWTYSIGCKNLQDCLEKVPASWKSFDVPQSDWWTEPGISKRREALRELTTIDIARVVDTRCLRDSEGGAASRHLAHKHARPEFRVDVALGFVCNSGRHRSVCVSEMTTAVLHRMGIVADMDHLCETDWRHLC